MDTVFIVRNEERYLIGVYRHHADAEAAIATKADDCCSEPRGSDEWQFFYDDYEIIEMPLE